MTAALGQVKRRGEHLDVASPLDLVTFLPDLDLIATLVHAEKALAGLAALRVLGPDLYSKLRRMSRLRRRELHLILSGGRG